MLPGRGRVRLGRVGLHHKICHVLGGTFNLPHAATHAVVLPYVLAFNAAAAPEASRRIAGALGARGRRTTGLEQLRRELYAPRALRDLGLREAGPRRGRRGQRCPRFRPSNPRPVDGPQPDRGCCARPGPGDPAARLTEEDIGMSDRDEAQAAREAELTATVLASFEQHADAAAARADHRADPHLHAFAREVRLTEAEWAAAIEFLTATGHITDDKRQEFILLSDVLGAVDADDHDQPPGARRSHRGDRARPVLRRRRAADRARR